jgi:hypothetical protein
MAGSEETQCLLRDDSAGPEGRAAIREASIDDCPVSRLLQADPSRPPHWQLSAEQSLREAIVTVGNWPIAADR